DPAAYIYLKNKVARMRADGESYGGYEKNRFYLNRGGESFLELAHLFGLALEEDSRNTVADDLDGDGRVDLLVTSYARFPSPGQVLRVYRNILEDAANWIGFRFQESEGSSLVGTRIEVQAGGRKSAREIINGDSHRSQHPNAAHFGLGTAQRIDKVTI